MTTMTKTMTIPEVRERIDRAENATIINFSPTEEKVTSRFQLDADGLMTFERKARDKRSQRREGIGEWLVSRDAYLAAGSFLGIPKAYVQRTPHELMIPHMNHWIANRGIQMIGMAAIDDQIEIFSRSKLDLIPMGRILDKTIEYTGGSEADLSAHHVSHTMYDTTLSIVTHEDKEVIERAAKRGGHVSMREAVRTGVTIEYSHAQAHPLTFSTYVHTMLCTNGMISAESIFRQAANRDGSDDGSDDWMFDALKAALDAGDEEIERQGRLASINFDGHMSDALQGVYSEFSVPVNIRELVTERVVDVGARTLYDVLNAVTWVASNHPDVVGDGGENEADPTLARKLMRIGGQVASHPEVCTNCHRVIA